MMNINYLQLGKNTEEIKWNSIIRQAIINDIIIKEIENYGVLKVSEKGKFH